MDNPGIPLDDRITERAGGFPPVPEERPGHRAASKLLV